LDFPSRESEGSFQFANFSTEVDDLHAVVQHFRESNRVIRAIVGHSKGMFICLLVYMKGKTVYLYMVLDVCQFIQSLIDNFPLYT
jgi:alpha/beta superfamily hydrolase